MRIVCFGGGTGMPALLSGLKTHPFLEVTAVVNMFDTGGSSGELKDRFGILPPGDVLKCVLALAEDEVSARRILLKRIQNAAHPNHTGGNVLLMGLEKVYGNYLDAVHALSQILSIHGRVLPVTQSVTTLCAEYADGSMARGEVHVDEGIGNGKRLTRLFLDPQVDAEPLTIEAIRTADVLVVGPGSFYTSSLPNVLPRGIREAIRASSARLVNIANLLTEAKGMEEFSLERIRAEVEAYAGRSVDIQIANTRMPDESTREAYQREGKRPLLATPEDLQNPIVIGVDVWQDPHIARHDSARLAETLIRVIQGARTQI